MRELRRDSRTYKSRKASTTAALRRRVAQQRVDAMQEAFNRYRAVEALLYAAVEAALFPEPVARAA